MTPAICFSGGWFGDVRYVNYRFGGETQCCGNVNRMTLFNNKYRIESARLPEWDYSCPGYYFVTVCTHDRGHLFGEIVNGEMRLNAFGQIVADEWAKSFKMRRELLRDEFVVMPNHFHGIVRLVATVNPVSTTISSETNRNCTVFGNTLKTIPRIGNGTGVAPRKKIRTHP